MSIRTTSVGSWWIPEQYADQLASYHQGALETSRAEKVLVDAAALAVKEQVELGFDEWTGGEYSSDEFVKQITRYLGGIRVKEPHVDYLFDYDDLPGFEIIGDIRATGGIGFAKAYERERNVEHGVKKASCLGPITMFAGAGALEGAMAFWDQINNVTNIINTELREMQALGCPHIVLDDPNLGIMLHLGTIDPDAAAELIAACFEGITTTRGIHICNGNLRGRPASPILRNADWIPLLQRLEGVIDIASLECHYFSEYLEREAFTELPKKMELAAGIVDEANYAVEPVAKIRDRATDWARVVGEDRLWISTSCGFGRHPVQDKPRIKAKLQNMVEAAQSL